MPNGLDTYTLMLYDRARELGEARNAESALEDQRALVKRDAIKRLIDAGAATSATAAEKIVEADAEYAAHRAAQFEAVIATQVAWAHYHVAVARVYAAAQAPVLVPADA